jgi:hypothetical protein
MLTPLKSQTIFTSFQPDDKGIGIGLRTNNLYEYISCGTFKLERGYLEYWKLAFGGICNTQNNPNWVNYAPFITYGIALHSYNKQSPQEFKRIVTYPISIELGAGAYIENICIAFRFDPIKNTSCIDIGWKF